MSTITAALPLTTTFVPPSTCISDTYLASSGCTTGTCNGLWMNLGPGPQATGACLPSGYSPYSYYSPGVCPSGYSIAYSSVGSGENPETFATCCPSSYTARTEIPASESGTAWYTYEQCYWQPTAGATIYEYTYYDLGSSWISATSTMDTSGMVNAYGVSIRFRDSPSTTSATSTSSSGIAEETQGKPKAAAKSSSTFDGAFATGFNAANEHPNSSSSGLSTGAKAGIGVGVAVAAVAVIAGLVWFCLVRKRRGAVATDKWQPAELEPAQRRQAELADSEPSVMTEYHGAASEPSAGTEYQGAFKPPQHRMPVELDAGVYYEK
ncbi:hypothetical protein N7474_001192 [Penicillium riverlandense]|uniref:uncharacterized protein n=1 Tax=Penicillium riverlandense TaxID=1903569 RepID=UPI002547FEE9|nr:uncharacterized protein N7474_001192 [Penicillium riverlandense]KAJ5832881.1 hypothetical protein N7474_001192 [Penicillium riverlandense]